MAAPEVLGISSGAALGVILLLFLLPMPDRTLQMLAGAAGAFGVLMIILMMGRRAAFSPDRLLLAGVATSAVFGAVVALAMATGDPRVGMLLTWMAGSTYQVDASEVWLPGGFALGMLALSPLLARWLEILPLGSGTASSLGMDVSRSRLVIMLATAVPTAIATLLIGPLSFVGLMAPHIARMMGLHRALHQVLGAALIGGLIMVMADWIGRTILFPFQVPAGLLATVIGGPYLMWLLRTRR
jgi:iron complex transport system permease protein